MRNEIIVAAAFLILLGNVFANEISVAYLGINNTFDPYEKSSLENLRFSRLVFDPLLRRDNNSNFLPSLAKSWAVIDERTTRLFLREGVKFHSGNKFDAKDILFTFNRIKESEDFKAIFSPIEKVELVSDYSVDFITKRSFPLLLNTLLNFYPMDSKYYLDHTDGDKIGEGSFASKNMSGTGPFILDDFEENKQTFIRNENYWYKKSGNTSRLTIYKVEDEEERIDGLLSGKYDVVNQFGSESVKKIEKDSRFNLVNVIGESLETFLINFERNEALKDINVRKAINFAVDQKSIIKKVMDGVASAANQFSPPSLVGHNENLAYRYDVTEAKELLSRSEYSNITLDLIVSDEQERDSLIAESVKSMLKEIGIEINIQKLPTDDYWDVVDNSGADLMLVGWYSDTGDSNNFYEFLMACINKETGFGIYNSGKYCNPDVDQFIQEANVVTKLDKRAQILKRIEKKLYDDASHLPVLWENLLWASYREIDLLPALTGDDVVFFGDLTVYEHKSR